MITKVAVRGFKSLEDAEVELGVLNVFVGANGSGKTNLLEAIGVLSAAADGKVNDQMLLQRGVRPGVPKLYKSSFAHSAKAILKHIYFSAASPESHYDVSLHNPLENPEPQWRFKTELLESAGRKIASRGPNMKENPNTESGLAALKAADLRDDDPALEFLRRLRGYAIFTPATAVLRGVAPETQPRQPVGLSGGRLPDGVHELLAARANANLAGRVCAEIVTLIGWAGSFGAAPSSSLRLSPSASASAKVVKFLDRHMRPKRNVLSGFDASEGALLVLFLAVLAAHPKAPLFCAIDNADHGLNPGLAKSLMQHFAAWLLESNRGQQVLITSHNPAVLDGLPLQDDRVRLFTVDRDNHGKTRVRRVPVDQKLLDRAKQGWTLSRLWTNGLIGGMPDV